MLTRRFAVRAMVVGVVAGTLGAVAVTARELDAASRAIHRDRHHVTADQRRDAERRLGAIEDVTLVTSDGLTLRGWYARSKNRAAVVLVHGGSGNRMTYIAEAEGLVRAGFGVLLFDSRASGESDGDLCSWGDREQRDVAAAVDLLVTRADVDPSRVGLVGGSIGATTVALFAAKDQRPRAVLLNAMWTSLEDEIDYKFGRRLGLLAVPALWELRSAGIDVDAVRPIDRVADIAPRPLFIVTGDADTDTPLPVMERVYARARDPKAILVVKGAGHCDCARFGGDAYLSAVVEFFRGALLGQR